MISLIYCYVFPFKMTWLTTSSQRNNSGRFTVLKNNFAWDCDMLTNSPDGALGSCSFPHALCSLKLWAACRGGGSTWWGWMSAALLVFQKYSPACLSIAVRSTLSRLKLSQKDFPLLLILPGTPTRPFSNIWSLFLSSRDVYPHSSFAVPRVAYKNTRGVCVCEFLKLQKAVKSCKTHTLDPKYSRSLH